MPTLAGRSVRHWKIVGRRLRVRSWSATLSRD